MTNGFPARLRSILAQKDISVLALSRLSGMSHHTIDSYLKSKSSPSISKAKIIADALNTCPAYLAFGVRGLKPELSVLIDGQEIKLEY